MGLEGRNGAGIGKLRVGIPPGDRGREEEATVLRPMCAGSCGRWKSQDPFRATQTSVGLGHQAQGKRDIAWDVVVGKLTGINP